MNFEIPSSFISQVNAVSDGTMVNDFQIFHSSNTENKSNEGSGNTESFNTHDIKKNFDSVPKGSHPETLRILDILKDPSFDEEDDYDRLERDASNSKDVLGNELFDIEDKEISNKNLFIDKHLNAIANSLIIKFKKELKRMNERGIFDEESNKTRLMHKIRERLKRIDWEYEKRKAETLFQEKKYISSLDVLDSYLSPHRTSSSALATSEREQWKRDSIFLQGKNEQEMKRIMKENERILQEINPVKKFVPKYMQQTLKQVSKGNENQLKRSVKTKLIPIHALIKRNENNTSLRSQLSEESRSSSTSTKNRKKKLLNDPDNFISLEYQLNEVKTNERKSLEENYGKVPDVNYTLSELMEKYVELGMDSQWESESKIMKSLSVYEPSILLPENERQASSLKKQVSKLKLVTHTSDLDRTSLRPQMLEHQKFDFNKEVSIRQQLKEIAQKKEVHYVSAYDSLQAEAFEAVESRRVEKQKEKIEKIHHNQSVDSIPNLSLDAQTLLQADPIIETNLDSLKRLEQLCDVLERCIVFLCAEFNNKKTYYEGKMPENVITMIRVCLACLRTLPIMNSRRAKRSWTKGAEVVFGWELNLDIPFSVHIEKHLIKLAEAYVLIHYETDQLLEYFVKSFRNKLKSNEVPESRSKEYLKTMFGDDSNDAKANIGRKKALERLLPGLNMLSEIQNLSELENEITNGNYSNVKQLLFEKPGTFSIFQETAEDLAQREKLSHKKKLLYSMNNYINYCNSNIQSLFQKYVNHYKEEKLKDGHQSLDSEFQRRTIESINDKNLLSKSISQKSNAFSSMGNTLSSFMNSNPSGISEITPRSKSLVTILPNEQSSSNPTSLKNNDKVSKDKETPHSATRKRVEEYVNIFNEWNDDWKYKFKDHTWDSKNPAHAAILEFRMKKDQLLHRKSIQEDETSSTDSNNDNIANYMSTESQFKYSYKQDYEKRQREKQKQKADGRYPFSSVEGYEKYKSKVKPPQNDMEPLRDENGILLTSFQILQLLEQVWDDLLYHYDKKIQLFEKYQKSPYTNVKDITNLYYIWRRAADLVLEREIALTKLEEFERIASDPLRFFNEKSSIKRLQEEKQRSIFFKDVCRYARSCEREARKLKKQYNELLEYNGVSYVEKMKTDYTNILYNLESKRLQSTEFSSYEALMEALQEKSRIVSAKK